MDCCVKIAIIICLILSALATVGAVVFALRKPKNRGKGKSMLVFIMILLAAVWCLRYPVGLYRTYNKPQNSTSAETADDGLHWSEEIVNSFIHSLQTFSMDEEYTDYLADGKQMVSELRENDSEAWVGAYSAYTSVINFVSPIVGGAIVLEVLANFFPSLRLWFVNKKKRKERYYFSELNEQSVALMNNIIDTFNVDVKKFFIFAGVDDNTDESLLRAAKSAGAVCVKKDIVEAIGNKSANRKILLISNDENRNLQVLTEILEKSTEPISDTEIYVFSTDKKFSLIGEEITYIVKQRTDTLGEDAEKRLPTVVPVDGTRNMAYTLLRDLPLYEPLINSGTQGKKKLNVTIFGSGAIGTQFFLATYWFGQILDCELCINVVSKEKQKCDGKNFDEGDFEGRINYVNPDIFRTADPNDEILSYNKNGDKNPPYFRYRYHRSDVLSDNFSKLMNDEIDDGFRLIDSDYFIVALGSDEDNFAVADKIRQSVGTHVIYENPKKKAIIAYVVYNSELCRSLNKKPKQKGLENVFMWAFGCMDEVYSVKNVFFGEELEAALAIGNSYDEKSKTSDKYRAESNANRFKDIYSYKANIARSHHYNYKVFSAGIFEKSIFESKNAKEYFDAVSVAREKYARYVVEHHKDHPDNRSEIVSLAWLEHRRWNAFLRANGFRWGDYTKYWSLGVGHKMLPLKIHPCLVETNRNGDISSQIDDRGIMVTESEFTAFESHDFLDDLSLDLRKRKTQEYEDKKGKEPVWEVMDDFKRWDYPMEDVKAEKISEILNEKYPAPIFKEGHVLHKTLSVNLYYHKEVWYISAARLNEIICKKLKKDGITADEYDVALKVLENAQDGLGTKIVKVSETNGVYKKIKDSFSKE
ncbi:MAG: hypothetical protein IKU25_05380 [Clostridia bacterium]|nr:hypothetical protein [Clostridia bacterium]